MCCPNCENIDEETITIIDNVRLKCEECGEIFLVF